MSQLPKATHTTALMWPELRCNSCVTLWEALPFRTSSRSFLPALLSIIVCWPSGHACSGEATAMENSWHWVVTEATNAVYVWSELESWLSEDLLTRVWITNIQLFYYSYRVLPHMLSYPPGYSSNLNCSWIPKVYSWVRAGPSINLGKAFICDSIHGSLWIKSLLCCSFYGLQSGEVSVLMDILHLVKSY